MRRDWKNVGKDHNGTDEQKARLGEMFDKLDWQEIPTEGNLSVAMMPGLGIKEAIKQLNLPKVSHIAISNEMAPFGLYGIKAHFKNGDANVYLCDEGSHITVLAVDFYEKEPEVKPAPLSTVYSTD